MFIQHTGSLGMDHTLWNSLTIKVCHFVHVDKVLHQHGTTGANGLNCLLVINGVAMTGCENFWCLEEKDNTVR